MCSESRMTSFCLTWTRTAEEQRSGASSHEHGYTISDKLISKATRDAPWPKTYSKPLNSRENGRLIPHSTKLKTRVLQSASARLCASPKPLLCTFGLTDTLSTNPRHIFLSFVASTIRYTALTRWWTGSRKNSIRQHFAALKVWHWSKFDSTSPKP